MLMPCLISVMRCACNLQLWRTLVQSKVGAGPDGRNLACWERLGLTVSPSSGVHACRVKLGPGGMDALVALGAGDMRRTLNILQVRRLVGFCILFSCAGTQSCPCPVCAPVMPSLHEFLLQPKRKARSC